MKTLRSILLARQGWYPCGAVLALAFTSGVTACATGRKTVIWDYGNASRADVKACRKQTPRACGRACEAGSKRACRYLGYLYHQQRLAGGVAFPASYRAEALKVLARSCQAGQPQPCF